MKAHVVYLSPFQRIAFERIQAQFAGQYNIPLSTGSGSDFNKEAQDKLLRFQAVAKQELIQANWAQADERGINVDGKNIW